MNERICLLSNSGFNVEDPTRSKVTPLMYKYYLHFSVEKIMKQKLNKVHCKIYTSIYLS